MFFNEFNRCNRQYTIPILSQIILFFINYLIFHNHPSFFSGKGLTEYWLLVLTLYTSIIMMIGYDRLSMWILGFLIFCLATFVTVHFFIETIPDHNIYLDVLAVFIIQYFIWFILKIIKLSMFAKLFITKFDRYDRRYTIPILAQIMLFLINYLILYAEPYQTGSGGSGVMERTLFVTIICTSIIMMHGYDRFSMWLLGSLIYYFATFIAVQFFIETIPRSISFINFDLGTLEIYMNAVVIFIFQFLIWLILKVAKFIYKVIARK